MKTAKCKSARFSVCLWFLQVIILRGLMSFLIWLILKPKHPIYKVVDVYISHFDGRNSSRNSTIHHGGRNSTFQHGWKSKFHGGSNSTNQNISIILKIEISNPNKRIGIYHDDIKVAVYHNGSFTGNNSVAGFHQVYRKTTFCEVNVNANKHSRTGIMGRRVYLLVNLRTEVQFVYDIFRYRTNRQQMDIDAYMHVHRSNFQPGNEN